MQRKSGVRWGCFQSAGGQGICERRIVVIMKMQKKVGIGGGGSPVEGKGVVRVENAQKRRGGVRSGGGGGQDGCVR